MMFLMSPALVILAAGFVWSEFSAKGPLLAISNLNTYNFIFLMLGLLLHRTIRSFLRAVSKAVPACAGVIIQFPFYGAIAALRDGEDFVSYFVDRCRKGRDVVNERLALIPRIRSIPSNGSFYAMFEVDGVMDTYTFCKRAVTEARIGMAPGIAFGRGAERMVRLCYAKVPELLHVAMDRLEAYVAGYKE